MCYILLNREPAFPISGRARRKQCAAESILMLKRAAGFFSLAIPAADMKKMESLGFIIDYKLNKS